MVGQTRPVWPDRGQLAALICVAQGHKPTEQQRLRLKRLCDQWDDAPADHTEAAQSAERVRVELVCAMRADASREPDLAAAHRDICAVLRALGYRA